MILDLLVVANFWRWVRRLGGLGLVLLGLADNSVVPLPGSMDLLTIALTIHHRDLWWYYALMATAGAVLGGYLTYRIARQGGKDALDKRLGKRRSTSFHSHFERWGFWSVAVPALLPPPFPFVPFLLVAGALQYPRGKFLAALALGRSVRYTLIAALGLVYGRQFLRFFSGHTRPTVYVVVGLVLAAAVTAGVIVYLRMKHLRLEDSEKPTAHAGHQRA